MTARTAPTSRRSSWATRAVSSGVDEDDAPEPNDHLRASKPEPAHSPVRHEDREKIGGGSLAGLHLVATPIGNLGDITQRALSAQFGVCREQQQFVEMQAHGKAER